MNKSYIVLCCFFSIILFSSFKTGSECQYAGANIDFAKNQTEKALDIADINIVRYHTYKAINAIEKTQEKLAVCGCEYAIQDLKKSLANLKLATKATDLDSTRILLLRSLEDIMGSLNALEDHHLHENKEKNDLIAINTTGTNNEATLIKRKPTPTIYNKIDSSLAKYKNSLNKVVETVNCKEAKAFVEDIIDQCQKELLRDDLSEGKKYYYLRTKEITAKALTKIGACETE